MQAVGCIATRKTFEIDHDIDFYVHSIRTVSSGGMEINKCWDDTGSRSPLLYCSGFEIICTAVHSRIWQYCYCITVRIAKLLQKKKM